MTSTGCQGRTNEACGPYSVKVECDRGLCRGCRRGRDIGAWTRLVLCRVMLDLGAFMFVMFRRDRQSTLAAREARRSSMADQNVILWSGSNETGRPQPQWNRAEAKGMLLCHRSSDG